MQAKDLHNFLTFSDILCCNIILYSNKTQNNLLQVLVVFIIHPQWLPQHHLNLWEISAQTAKLAEHYNDHMTIILPTLHAIQYFSVPWKIFAFINPTTNLHCFAHTGCLKGVHIMEWAPHTKGMGRGGPQGCEMSRPPHFLDNQLTDGSEAVRLTRQLPFNAQEDSRYSFLLEAVLPPRP
jgi:hypothetical protein